MVDLKQTEGKLVKYSLEGTGKKKDGSDWKRFKYTILTNEGERTFSGFLDPTSYANKHILISYDETDGVAPDGSPVIYKNLKTIVEGVGKEEVAETDKKYNVKEVGHPQPNFNEGSFYGMCSNQAIKWILKKDLKYQESFSQVFDIIWEANVKKRKEKLG